MSESWLDNKQLFFSLIFVVYSFFKNQQMKNTSGLPVDLLRVFLLSACFSGGAGYTRQKASNNGGQCICE